MFIFASTNVYIFFTTYDKCYRPYPVYTGFLIIIPAESTIIRPEQCQQKRSRFFFFRQRLTLQSKIVCA